MLWRSDAPASHDPQSRIASNCVTLATCTVSIFHSLVTLGRRCTVSPATSTKTREMGEDGEHDCSHVCRTSTHARPTSVKQQRSEHTFSVPFRHVLCGRPRDLQTSPPSWAGPFLRSALMQTKGKMSEKTHDFAALRWRNGPVCKQSTTLGRNISWRTRCDLGKIPQIVIGHKGLGKFPLKRVLNVRFPPEKQLTQGQPDDPMLQF